MRKSRCVTHDPTCRSVNLELTMRLTPAQVKSIKQVAAEVLGEQARLMLFGSRVPALLQLTQEWQDNEPFIDKLNRAEKLGMLPSTEQWQLLRELRNQTAYEYPAQPELVVTHLQQLLNHVPMLEQAHLQLSQAAARAISTATRKP